MELTEDQTSERHQELLAEFERRKKVNIWKGNFVLELKVCDQSFFVTCRAGIFWWVSLHEFWIMNVRHGPFLWLRNDAFIYNIIINCRQYCLGLLGLISAVLMSGMKVSHKSHLECPTHVVTPQSRYSAQTRELVSVRNR